MIEYPSQTQFFSSNEIDFHRSLIHFTGTTWYILISMITLLIGFLSPQLTTKYTPTPIFTPAGGSEARRGAAHKSRRQFFGTEVREIGTSLKDGTENGYNLDEHENLNYGKEFFKLSFVRAKTSVVRVQATL